MAMEFLKTFKKELEKMDGVSVSSTPPRYWYSTGNFVLNRIISGSFFKGVPQGRITDLAGAAGAGKSFLAANLVKAAQKAGAMVLIVDSENSLDDEFMGKIGVNTGTENDYYYAGVSTIPQVTDVVSKFIKGYKKEAGDALDAPHLFILIDSLDMLMTETEQEHYEKGDSKGDQGQRNKQLKAMLRSFVQDIKQLNIVMVCTSQVYKNQDLKSGDGVWIVSEAVKYACSQIVMLTKLKLKEDSAPGAAITGIRMTAEGYKTRFTLPFQKVVVEVPYSTGMDPYSGLIETAQELGVIGKAGSYYDFNGEKFYSKDIALFAEAILKQCELKVDQKLMGTLIDNEVVDNTPDPTTAKSKRAAKATS